MTSGGKAQLPDEDVDVIDDELDDDEELDEELDEDLELEDSDSED